MTKTRRIPRKMASAAKRLILAMLAFGAANPAAGVAQALAPAEQPNTYALRADRLIDPTDGSSVENVTVLVTEGFVTLVGSDIRIPNGVPVIDLQGQTLLPGVIDAHVHLMSRIPVGVPPDGWVTNTPMARRALIGVRQARETLLAGFTTVRDIGNSGNYVDIELRNAIAQGVVWGPTIIPAGKIIAPFGGQSHLNPERIELGSVEYFAADSPEEMIKAVRQNVHFGAEVIKIVVDGQPYLYTPDDIRVIVEEASHAGRKVAAHVLSDEGARNAIEAGVASLEHAWNMSDETLDMARAKGVSVVTSDFTVSAMRLYRWSEPLIRQFRGGLVDRMRRAYDHDVDMVFGSDLIWASPECDRGTCAMEQIDSFIEAGATPLQILQALTVNAARLLSMEGSRGRVAPGYAADIIAVPANPLDDISTLKNVTFVMKDGRVAKGG